MGEVKGNSVCLYNLLYLLKPNQYVKHDTVERTGAWVEWLTPVPEVPGSILSRPFVVALSMSHSTAHKLIDFVKVKKILFDQTYKYVYIKL